MYKLQDIYLNNIRVKVDTFAVAPILLIWFSFIVYVPFSVMLNLQPLSSGESLEQLPVDTKAGPSTSILTLLLGGVYPDDNGDPYCRIEMMDSYDNNA